MRNKSPQRKKKLELKSLWPKLFAVVVVLSFLGVSAALILSN